MRYSTGKDSAVKYSAVKDSAVKDSAVKYCSVKYSAGVRGDFIEGLPMLWTRTNGKSYLPNLISQ